MRFDLEAKDQQLVGKQTLKKGAGKRLTLHTLKTSRMPLVQMQDTIIVGDISGSMAGNKLYELQKALTEVWQPGVSGVVFNSQVYTITKEDIMHLDADGGTCMFKALEVAWQEDHSHIILITDGDATDESPEYILHYTKTNHPKPPIDTIGIGDHGRRDYNPAFLRELAEATGGKFTDCGEAIKLSAIVQRLLLEHRAGALKGPMEGGAIQL